MSKRIRPFKAEPKETNRVEAFKEGRILDERGLACDMKAR